MYNHRTISIWELFLFFFYDQTIFFITYYLTTVYLLSIASWKVRFFFSQIFFLTMFVNEKIKSCTVIVLLLSGNDCCCFLFLRDKLIFLYKQLPLRGYIFSRKNCGETSAHERVPLHRAPVQLKFCVHAVARNSSGNIEFPTTAQTRPCIYVMNFERRLNAMPLNTKTQLGSITIWLNSKIHN